MILELYKKFGEIYEKLLTLEKFLIFVILLHIGAFTIYVVRNDEKIVLTLLSSFITVLAVYAAMLIAERLIVSNFISREEDLRKEINRITNHLIVINLDLLGKVEYVKVIINDGLNHPSFELIEIILSIENRYDMFLENADAYKFLSKECTEIILGIADKIIFLKLLIKHMTLNESELPTSNVQQSITQTPQHITLQLDTLINKLKNFDTQIRLVRNKIIE